MKTISTILVLIIAISSTFAVNPEEKKAHMMKIFNDCKTSTGATDDDMAKLMMHSKPATHEGMCLFSCILENMGITKDGKLNNEGLYAWEKSMNGVTGVADTVIAECGAITHSDVCQAASDLGFCFKTTAKRLGVIF